MTIHFSLSGDAEARLRKHAEASGLSPDDLARQLVEQAVAAPTNGTHDAAAVEATGRLASFRRWSGSVKVGRGSLDDDRGSIYSGRGE